MLDQGLVVGDLGRAGPARPGRRARERGDVLQRIARLGETADHPEVDVVLVPHRALGQATCVIVERIVLHGGVGEA